MLTVDVSPDGLAAGVGLTSPAARRPEPSLEDFELLKLVGRGGFGKVYQVRKRATGRIMALKAMRKHLVITELNVEGARNEREALESISHPFVVRLHCAFHDHGRLYLLMDWHNGGQLLARFVSGTDATARECV
ncbi:kinase-like domain-containing protein [Baffinella frigidus]|nr:kinase-like domain-containing protein [Cryptophyta sp. CCMP2293]